jgi:DNA-binding MarR family transcriptional regulator
MKPSAANGTAAIEAAANDAAHLVDRLERLARAGEQSGGLNPAQWDALRYLARANRFSRTPAALAEYLATTRGTVSRTLASLEEKGLIARLASDRDGRSVDFDTTEAGRTLLAEDPLAQVADNIAQATQNEARHFADLLQRVLRAALARNRGRAFGMCRQCRHFRADRHSDGQGALQASHHCALLDVPLSDADSGRICAEQTPADV